MTWFFDHLYSSVYIPLYLNKESGRNKNLLNLHTIYPRITLTDFVLRATFNMHIELTRFIPRYL